MNQHYLSNKLLTKSILLTSLCTIIYLFPINAQTLELGILAGGANYQGDLASSEFSVITKQTNFAIGGRA